ncbi:DegT/DnrJ/EryC1/StrS family aminotransferase [bacterium]|nr:DegT/DnrJ/EryC1/StrS family aminotransferase [bacterium]
MYIWRCDLTKQTEMLLEQLLQETKEVLLSGKYILGKKLERFEEEFAAYTGTRYAVGVASGTEAIYLALVAAGVKHGDEVITTPFTAIPTFSAILMTGAKAVFADINPLTYTIDPNSVADKITSKTKALLPVHLFGQMAEMDELRQVANRHGIKLIEDAAQSHGSLYKGSQAGAFGEMACYSFYPTKNLGAFGDAGAIVTNQKEYYDQLKLLRNYGQEALYRTVINGINSRLDELQAAYLSIKLKHLDHWNEQRSHLAGIYYQQLNHLSVQLPCELTYTRQNYHVYVIRTQKRDALQQFLEEQGIQTNIYYPIPLHLQKSNAFLGYNHGDFPEAERACEEVLALPMYPEMDPEIAIRVSKAIKQFYKY